MQELLDERIDEIAASAHAGIGARIAVTIGVGLIGLALLSWQACVAWSTAALGFEAWSWFATRAQFKQLPIRPGQRLNHLLNLAVVNASWFVLALLFWRTGTSEGAICAVAIWLSQMAFAQSFAYQSPIGFLVSGAAPALAMLIVVLITPNPALPNLTPVWATLLLSVIFIGAGARQTLAARRQYTQAQDRLKASEAGYRLLANNVTDVIALNAPEAARIYVSPSVERVLGLTPEELSRTPYYSFAHPDDAARLQDAVASLGPESNEQTVEYRARRKDGSFIWVESCFALVNDGSGHVISVSRDITNRKQLEFDLIEAMERAQAAAAAKSDFLANMTHELRTPLNAIIGFSGVLRQSKALAGLDARHVELIHEASGTLLSVVNDVLDFSKLESGGYELDPHPFDPAAMARSVAALVEHQAAAKGLSLSVQTRGADGPLVGDSERLRQVLLNFLSNAAKFTSQGDVEVLVDQSGDGERRRLRVEVKDRGIGIPAGQLEQIFERFTQADVSVSRQFGGTGLGLAISKRIIEAMDGRIGATSVEGEGSTFWFEVVLPVAERLGDEAAHADRPTEFDQGLRLLLVEDNAVNRELVCTLLGAFDIEIETAADGAAAVEAVQRSTYDLVLMDVQMPVMDGLTATRRIRAIGTPETARLPIIAMTANVLPDQVARCLDAGMNDHLGKPISPTSLLEILGRWATPSDADPNAEGAAGGRRTTQS